MKSILKYILTLVVAFSFIACSMDDIDTSISNSGTTIEFIARPTSFITCNVETRAIVKEDFEDDIENAYFLLYDNTGDLVDVQSVSQTGLRFRYTFDSKNPDLTGYKVCFIANVPEARIPDVGSEWAQLEATVLDITYIDQSDYDFPVPSLNGTPCLPMFGYTELSAHPTQTVAVDLKSLFAKVNLNIELDFSESLSDWTALLKGDASFKLTSISLINLPKKVSIIEPQESSWVNDRESFSGDIEVTTEIEVTEESTFTCYVPEYILNSTGRNTDQTKKSSFVSGDKYPVHFTVEGVFHHPNMIADVPFTYTIHLGENVYDDFNIKRNKLYNFNMAVTGINQARLDMDDRVEVEMPHEDLSASETANCYTISKVGRYCLKATKGNTDESIGDIPVDENGKILNYETVTDNGANVLSNIKYKDGYIWFDVNMADLSQVTNGNTMLIIKSGNNVLWSWHLWFDGGFYDSSLSSIGSETYSGTNATMMNRNLGAGSQGGKGVYYKWGDKSPYFNNSYQGGITGGTWASSKTKTDPCPPGYQIPTSAVWYTRDDWYKTSAPSVQTSSSFIYDVITPNVLYPYSGYFIANEQLGVDVITTENFGSPEFEYVGLGVNTGTTIPVSVKISGRTFTLNLPQMARDRFSELDMEIEMSHNEGRVWSIHNFLKYKYSTLNLAEMTLDAFRKSIKIKSYKHERQELISYTIENPHLVWNGWIPSLGYDKYEPIWGDYKEITPSMSDSDKLLLLEQLWEQSVIAKIDYSISSLNEEDHSTYGYQVRCVSSTSQEK